MENKEHFISISISKHNELIKQIKDYEDSLVKIYHYVMFKDKPTDLIKKELNEILTKYYQ